MQTSILPLISECIIAFNLQLQQYITIGPCITMLSGYPEKKVPADVDFWYDIIHPDDIQRVKKGAGSLTHCEAIELNYRILPSESDDIRYISEKKSIYTDIITGDQILLSVLNECTPVSESDALKREQFLLSLINSQTNFLVRLDKTGRFTFINKRYCDVFGYTPAELTGEHFAINTAPEDMQRCRAAFEDCLANPGEIISLVREKLDKTGDRHPSEWEFIAITNRYGEVTEIQGVGQDISHKIKSENKVKQTLAKLDNFIESITDSFLILDTRRRFIKTNKAFEKLSHRTQEELAGKVIWDVFPTLMSGQSDSQFLLAEKMQQSVQYTEYVKSSNLWVRITAYPSVEGLTVFIKDITEQKIAEEELNLTRNNLESLINNTDDLVWSIDTNAHYIYINNSYKNAVFKETGIIPANGGPVVVYGPAEIIDAWNEYYRRALEGESYSIVYENTHTTPGILSYYEVNFNPICNDAGAIAGTGCFAREITSRLQSEKEIIAQNERLRHIASLSSHELRRPVASMLGLINVIDFENFSNPDNKEAINLLLVVGNEIDEVIRNIVDNTFSGLLPVSAKEGGNTPGGST